MASKLGRLVVLTSHRNHRLGLRLCEVVHAYAQKHRLVAEGEEGVSVWCNSVEPAIGLYEKVRPSTHIVGSGFLGEADVVFGLVWVGEQLGYVKNGPPNVYVSTSVSSDS